MSNDDRLTEEEAAAAKTRFLAAMKLQEVEGNPFTEADLAMFEMFERERWSHERCRAYILERIAKRDFA